MLAGVGYGAFCLKSVHAKCTYGVLGFSRKSPGDWEV